MLGQGLALLKKAKWKKKYIELFCQILKKQVLMAENDGYKIHITDIYLDEIEKVGANVVSFSIKQCANVLTNMYISSFSHNFNKCKLSKSNIYLILIFIE